MKVQDIHKAFKVAMDKNAQAVAYGGCPAFLPAEEDLFLNQAYNEVISNKFTGTTVTKVAFEGSVNRIADLEGLIITEDGLPITTSLLENSVILEDFTNETGINKGYRRMFYVSCILLFDNLEQFQETQHITCTLVDHETARRFKKTYNNRPWIDIPVATIEDNKLKIYYDDVTMKDPSGIILTYVKRPEVIDYTKPDMDITEVPEYVMYEVINRAAVIALENIESQRTGTKVQINNLQE